MKRLKILVTITFILSIISALALILQYLALADIAKEPNSILEWRIVGVCMLILTGFVISTFATLIVLLKLPLLSGGAEKH
jgi:hypothetical protein